jgi:hypothetical protein
MAQRFRCTIDIIFESNIEIEPRIVTSEQELNAVLDILSDLSDDQITGRRVVLGPVGPSHGERVVARINDNGSSAL